jgi:hypothetical protein
MSTPPAPSPPVPRSPGGRETAPEITAGGCAHAACSCVVEPGHRYCCRACARAPEDAPACRCGHFACTDRAW